MLTKKKLLKEIQALRELIDRRTTADTFNAGRVDFETVARKVFDEKKPPKGGGRVT